MKKTLFAWALMALMTTGVYAQNANQKQRNPEKMAEKMTERMTENLSLTEDQKTAVYDANFKFASADKEDRKAAMDKYDADMKEILNEDQYEKWKAKRKERMEKRKKRN